MSETNSTDMGLTAEGKGAQNDKGNLDFILDIPLEITVELGRTRMMVNELLKLGQGSVIELGKIAGETLEILANNRLIARGDVVVINDKYGIRLTEVISPAERVEKLG
jgi:flagellar motor switch protein FliN